MKKIAYVIPLFPVASETFITTEMRALMKLGHKVQGICFERSQQACQVGDEAIDEGMLDTQDVKVIALSSLIYKLFSNFFGSGFRGLRFAFEQQGIRPRSLILQALKLAYLTHKTGCDHIHAHFALCSTATAIVAARLLGLSVSFTSHGSDVYKAPSDLALKLQNADFSIAVCKRMQIDFKNFTPDAQVYTVPCGIDLDFFNSHNVISHQAVSQHHSAYQQKLLYLGRISETKGILHLVQALAKLPVHLRPCIDIAGDGPMKEETMQMAQEFGLSGSVKFLGGVSRQWIKDNSSDYAAMVLPFCKVEGGIMDTGPLVIKETLALKLPLLTTDSMATGEFVDSDSAFISNSSDPEDLARTLLKLLMALGFVAVDSINLAELEKVLGPRVHELTEVINHPKPKKIVEDKIDQGYRKVVDEYSSKKQGLMLSRIFQSA